MSAAKSSSRVRVEFTCDPRGSTPGRHSRSRHLRDRAEICLQGQSSGLGLVPKRGGNSVIKLDGDHIKELYHRNRCRNRSDFTLCSVGFVRS